MLQLQQLTFLEIESLLERVLEGPRDQPASLQPLSALTRPADLRIGACGPCHLSVSALAGASSLTHLALSGNGVTVDPAALAGKTQLQHLEWARCMLAGTSEEQPQQVVDQEPQQVAVLLSQLQQLTQLTQLQLPTCNTLPPEGVPAAAYSALTVASCSTSTSQGASCHQAFGSMCSPLTGSCHNFGCCECGPSGSPMDP